MPELSVDKQDDGQQRGKGLITGLKDIEVPVKHYPLIAKRMAGPLMTIQPHSFLDQVTQAINIGADILVLESAEA